jgi:predicted enzyme related to lactoylglutathione lyase
MAEDKPTGRFVWFDLITTHPDQAPGFYGKVAGWGTQAWDGPAPYTMWINNGTPIGGIGQLPNASARPHWLAHISTADVDATVRTATDLGSKVITPPTDIPTVGRFAVVADPQGAVFGVFTPKGEAPGHEGEPELGEFSWHELTTHDHPAAFRFYERLFGWQKTSAMDMGPMGTYQMFGRNGVVLGGMYNKTAEMPAPPSWLYYVRVEDVQRAVDAVTSNGGKVVNGPMEVPGGDWIAQCVDPQGAPFAVHAKKTK